MWEDLCMSFQCMIQDACVMQSTRLTRSHISESHTKITNCKHILSCNLCLTNIPHLFFKWKTDTDIPSSAPMQSLKCGYALLSFRIRLCTLRKLGSVGLKKCSAIATTHSRTSWNFLLMVSPECLKLFCALLFDSLPAHMNRNIASIS